MRPYIKYTMVMVLFSFQVIKRRTYKENDSSSIYIFKDRMSIIIEHYFKGKSYYC